MQRTSVARRDDDCPGEPAAPVEYPLDSVRTLIRAHVAAMLADADKHSTMLTHLRALTGQRRAEIVALRDAYEQLVRSIIARAQNAGVLRGTPQ